MPSCSPKSAVFLRVRWSTYLSQLLKTSGASKTQVSRALDVPSSRISKWLDGTRLVLSETAFEVGENLRDKLGWPTSGPEALYACGNFIELFQFLKHLSVDYAADGESLAVKFYCWLPAEFLPFEVTIWDKQILGAAQNGMVDEIVVRNMREGSLLEQEIDLYHFHKDRDAQLRGRLSEDLRSPSVRAAIIRAWTGFQRNEFRPTTAPFVTRKFTQTVLGKTVTVSSTSGKMHFLDAENNGIVDAVIDVAFRLRHSIPSFAATRLWRLLGEWAQYVDRASFEEWSALLPHVYKTWEPNELTEDEIDYLRMLEHERDARRH